MTGRVGPLAVRAVALGVLWWILTEGREGYGLYGVVAVAAAVAVSLGLAPPGRGPDRPGPGLASRAAGLVSLTGWYSREVLRGGVDVARRILRRRPDVAPVVVEVVTRLPDGAARHLAVAMFGLMPGSLVSQTRDDRVSLHGLAAELDTVRQWRELEEHLAAVAGLHLPAEG